MCLAIRGKLISTNNEMGLVEQDGVMREVCLLLLPEAKPGDILLVHAGFAIQKYAEAKAQ